MVSKEIGIYTADNIRKKDDSLFLEITLDNQIFNLPIINVGDKLNPEYIAILNPMEPGLGEAGANVLAEMLKQLEINLIITAPSLKSEEMVLEANQKSGISHEPIVMLGGSIKAGGEKYTFSEEEVIDLASPNGEKYWIEECRPITLGPEDPSKFFAINEEILLEIIKLIEQGKKIAIVDDVYSSGATVESLKRLIGKALQEKGAMVPSIPIVVVAREALGETEIFKNPEALEADNQALNLYASILIPVLLEVPEL
jgi:hypothetical protein